MLEKSGIAALRDRFETSVFYRSRGREGRRREEWRSFFTVGGAKNDVKDEIVHARTRATLESLCSADPSAVADDAGSMGRVLPESRESGLRRRLLGRGLNRFAGRERWVKAKSAALDPPPRKMVLKFAAF